MAPVWYDDDTALAAGVAALAALGPAARRVLARAVAEQGYVVSRPSPAAESLHDLGLLYIRESNLFDTTAELVPSLLGEEALATLESTLKRKKP